MKKLRFIAAVISLLMLTACGKSGEPNISETETVTETAADTEQTAAETTAAETTTAETTETTEEITSSNAQTVAEVTENSSFRLYEPEVKDGAPEICDLEAIKARRRSDMAENYTGEADNWDFSGYSDPVDIAEKFFGYSFDDSDPVTSYIEDDFDLDGNTEYYLCMAEYALREIPDAENNYDATIVTSIYYIDDDSTLMNTFSRLIQMAIPESLYGNSAEEALNNRLNDFSVSESNLKFQIYCGYGSFNAPIVIDNGDSKHILWKNDNSYPGDFGAYIFWGDKYIRTEISAPSESLGGFYEWNETIEDLFFKEKQENFDDDFWATTVNLATKLDLYTYPEINGKVNTMKWDGQNYVYSITAPKNEETLKSGPIEWK